MLKTLEAGEAGPSARALHSCLIAIGGTGAHFKKAVLELLQRQQETRPVRVYFVDVSPSGDLEQQLGQAWRPDPFRVEVKWARAEGDDASVYRTLSLLMHDYDPSVRLGQVVTDLPPRAFPLATAACRELASEWFYGRGPKGKVRDWPYARLAPAETETFAAFEAAMDFEDGSSFPLHSRTGKGFRDRKSLRVDAGGGFTSPWQTQSTLKDLLSCVVGRRFPRRPTALVVGQRMLRETFAGRLAGSEPTGLSFIQLAGDSSRPDELWSRDAGPDLVFCDEPFYSRRGGLWPEAAWVVSEGDDTTASDSPALVPGFDAPPVKGARAKLPDVIVSWTRRDPDYVTPVWVTNPLGRGGHSLPAARHYQPTPELDELRRAWGDGEPKVWALTGAGGCGKTSLVQHFLEECRPTADVGEDGGRREGEMPSADAVFVWDFYANPQSEKFLAGFAEYVSAAGGAAAVEDGWLERVRAGLHSRNLRRVLLVLDGLETIQTPEGGGLTDPLAAELLEEAAAGRLPLTVVVTTRLAPALRARQGEGYFATRLGALPFDAACALMRAYSLRGEAAELAALADRFGRHALTLTQVCRVLCDAYGGDFEAVRGRLTPRREPGAAAGTGNTEDMTRALMAPLVALYEELLPAPELGILRCLAASGEPLTAQEFAQIFRHTAGATRYVAPATGLTAEEVQSGFEHLRGRELVTVHAGPGVKPRYSVHPALSRHFAARLTDDAREALNLDVMSYYQRRLGAMLKGQEAGGRTRGTVRTRRVAVGPGDARPDYPTDPTVLDALEKIIFHAARAGRVQTAKDYYEGQMGGAKHLSAIGQRARALRIGAWLTT
jgi:hypothetical protein